MQPKKLKLGGHLMADRGLSFVVASARGLAYNEVQVMLGEGTAYSPREIDEADAIEFQKMTYEIAATVHLPYVINPCESNPRRRGFYKTSVRKYVEAAITIGACRVVLHPGYKKSLSPDEAFNNLVNFIDDLWDPSWDIDLLLETDSGSKNGSAIGSANFIHSALAALDNNRVAMCVDTAHLYARGVDLWNSETRAEFLGEFGPSIRLVHLNIPDPEVRLGSFLDRHNSPFTSRNWDHKPFLESILTLPWILERRSLSVQREDTVYLRDLFDQPLEKRKA